MTWASLAACVLLTEQDLRAHDRALRPGSEPTGDTGPGTDTDDSPTPHTDGHTGTPTDDPDGDGSFARATPVTPATWEPSVAVKLGEAYLDPPDDHDFWSLPLDAGEIVLLWVEAYEEEDAETCDAFLRLHRTSDAPWATNDDMLYLFRKTDPALFYQAQADEQLVVEVVQFLESMGTPGLAGPQCDYELWAMPRLPTEVPNNDTRASVLTENLSDLYVPTTFTSSGYYEALGELSPPTDVDLFPVDVGAGNTLYVSLWPSAQVGLEGVTLSLLAEDGTVLAANAAPEWVNYVEYGGVTEATLVHHFPTDTQVFWAVSAGAVTGPPLYAAMMYERLPGYVVPEVEDPAPVHLPWPVPAPDTVVQRTWGSVGPGDVDTFQLDGVDVGRTLPGRWLNVVVQARTIGSFGELSLEILGEDGTTVLATSSTDFLGRDPALADWEVPAGEGTVFLRLSALSGSGNYLLTTSVGNTP